MSAREYLLGAPIALQIALVDGAGVALVPTQSPRWRMLDQAEQEVSTWAPIDPVNGVIVINLDAAATTLPAGQSRAFRMIEVQVVTLEGTVSLFSEIMLRSPTLVVPSQSFQLYGEAAMVAESAGKLDGWRNAAKGDRELALIEAASRIGRFNFGVGTSQDRLSTDDVVEGHWPSRRHFELSELTEVEFNSLHPRLLKALRLAQVYEADYLLTPESQESSLREQGVTSVRVGESSTQFTARKRLELGLCPRAYAVITPWVIRGTRIGRA